MSNSAEVFRVNFAGKTARLVYSDAAMPLVERLQPNAARRDVRRMSHVEPHWRGGWYADMRPSGGDVLFATGAYRIATRDDVNEYTRSVLQGARGFETRQEALDAERVDLRARLGI